MKVYHIAYEPSYQSLDVHFWTECNLKCQGCYTNYEKLDFGLMDDPVAEIAVKAPETEPEKYLSYGEVLEHIKDLKIKYALFMGTEAALDPELPRLAKTLHEDFGSYNMLLTNGVKLTDMGHIDEIICSIKAFSGDIFREYTGRSNEKVLHNFKEMWRSVTKFQAETVLIPDYIDAKEIEQVAKFVASVDKDITLRIDAYFPVPGCSWRAATKAEVEEAAELAKKHLNSVTILTLDMKRVGDKAVKIF
ncbi:MAG: radical SAM protein [Anaerolineales bacterium]|nr:radical SAM protein [Anaerolineales bacterium]